MSCLHIFYKNDNEYEYEMDSYSLSMLTLSNKNIDPNIGYMLLVRKQW